MRATRLSLLVLTFAAACARTPTVDVTVNRIDVSPPSPLVPAGLDVPLAAIARQNDGSVKDVAFEWKSADPAIATVDSKGLVNALKVGDVEITATWRKVVGRAHVKVTPARLVSIAVAPASLELAVGRTQDVVVTATLTDGSTVDVTSNVTWAIEPRGVASAQGPTVAALREGTATATATVLESTGTSASVALPITVLPPELDDLRVEPALVSLPIGVSKPLHAIATLSDGSTRDVTDVAVWRLETPGIVELSGEAEPGVIVARAAGTTNVIARWSGREAAASVEVTAAPMTALELVPATQTLGVRTRHDFRASAIYGDGTVVDVTQDAEWSGDETLLQISNERGSRGTVVARASGLTTLRASFGGLVAEATITVTSSQAVSLAIAPARLVLPIGTTGRFVATVTYADGSVQDVTEDSEWSSSDASHLEASDVNGSFVARAAGEATVTAVFGGVEGSAIAVIPASAVVALELSPATLTLPRGASGPLAATARFADGTTTDVTAQVMWSSSDPLVTTVDAGLVTAVTAGEADVTATLPGTVPAISGSSHVVVSAAILTSLSVTPPAPTLARGTSLTLAVEGHFDDGTSVDVTSQALFTSSNEAVATASSADGQRGLVSGRSLGSTTITVDVGGVTTTVVVRVTGAALVSISLAPASATGARGDTIPFTARATWDDGTSLDVTQEAVWTSSTESVATVSNGDGSRGTVTLAAAGTSTISASWQGLSASAQATCSTARLVSISVTPPSLKLAIGTTSALAATGTYDDGTSRDLTTEVTWTSSDPTRVTVSNAAAEAGTLRAVASGSTTITASTGTLSASALVDVTAASLRAIDLTPAAPTLAAGTSTTLRAVGSFDDGTTQDLSSQVSWLSSDPQVAAISTAPDGTGQLTGLRAGNATISATFAGITGRTTATVTAAVLQAIDVQPSTSSISAGTTRAFTATGRYSDGTTQELTGLVAWTSSDTSVLTISIAPDGTATASGLRAGAITLTASLSAVTGTARVDVTAAVLVSIDVTPAAPSLAVGTTSQLTATGTFSDGRTQDLTAQAAWASDQPTKAQVSSAAGSAGLVTALAIGSARITATVGTIAGSTTVTVTAATLRSLTISPASSQIALGLTQPLVASGTYSDGTTQDLTTQVTWTTSDASIAAVSNAQGSFGEARALAKGTATITATLGTIASTATLTVTDAALRSIALTPAQPTLAKGTTLQLVATGTYSDATTKDLTTQVSWSSAAPTVASVSNAAGSQGRASALAVGSSAIGASLGSITGTTQLTVTPAVLRTLALAPQNASIAAGLSQAFTATATFSDSTTQDVTTQVTWSSSVTTVAVVSNAAGSQGQARALTVGLSTIGASLAGVSATTQLTVTAALVTALEVSPAAPALAKGSQLALRATATFSDGTTGDVTTQATWASAQPAIVAVSNAGPTRGHVNALTVGSSAITATLGTIVGTTTVTVTPATLRTIGVSPTNPSIAKGTSQRFTATGTYSDGTTQDLTAQATWSADASIATISNAAGSNGTARGVGQGTTTVSASFAGISGTTTLTVTPATLMSIAVTPAALSLAKGTTQALVATGTYSDGTTQAITAQVTWSIADASIASVSNVDPMRGTVQALSTGSSTLTATLGAVSGTASITVTDAVLRSLAVTPTNPFVAKASTARLTATGTYSDGTTVDLTTRTTWTSGTTSVATVSNAAGTQGQVNALVEGTTLITATLGTISGTTTVTVTPATLVSISITPATPTVARGGTVRLVASGVFSDGTSQDVTTRATWASATTTTATVSNAAGSQGLVTGVAAGTSQVSASVGNVTGQVLVTVTAATLRAIQITPAAPSLVKGTSQAFTATGTYTDDTTQDVTTQVTWSTTAAAVATVSNAAGSQGRATAVGAGSTTLTASLGGISGTTTITVTAATLSSITVTLQASSLARGTTTQATATGTYGDGTTQDLTTQVTWSAGTATVATVSNAAGTQGLVTALADGSSTIVAALGNVSGSASLTVSAASIVSITVAPTTTTLAVGGAQALVATGVFSDGTSQDVTTQATWTSSAPGTASVSTAPGSQGRVTALAAGTTTITAVFRGITGTATVTVSTATLVSITLQPQAPQLPVGGTQNLQAIGTYSDGTQEDVTAQATWSSSQANVASVSTAAGSAGLVRGLAPGTSAISARLGTITGQTNVTVTPARLVSIAITPTNPSIAQGSATQLSATGTWSDGTTRDLTPQATWTSTNGSVATVVPGGGQAGRVQGVGAGTSTISAVFQGVSGSTTLTVRVVTLVGIFVSPFQPTIARFTSQAFTATGSYSDGSTQDLTAQATWSSSAQTVAFILQGGRAQGVGTGTATITATFQGVSGSTVLTVSAAQVQSIAIVPASATLAVGTSQRLAAIGTFSDGSTQDVSTQVQWQSSSGNATVTNGPNAGLVTANRPGNVTITVRVPLLGLTATASITVTNATLASIAIAPATASLVRGETVQLAATGTYSDGTTQDLTALVTWTSGTTGVATVSNAGATRGLVTATGTGSSTLTATLNNVRGTAAITVTPPAIRSIAVTPATASVPVGQTLQLTATATYADGSTGDVTTQVTWTSGTQGTGTISSAGVVTGVVAGAVTFTATSGSLTATAAITVTTVALTGLAISPATASIGTGTTQRYTATGTYADGSTRDLTAQVTWTSSNNGVATVSSAGLATGAAAGTTTITAAAGTFRATSALTVTAATLRTITVTPGASTVGLGTIVSYVATGTYSDGSTQNLTLQATWASSSQSIATIDNTGLATTRAFGLTSISATFNGLFGTASLTVTQASLTSITLTPADSTVARGAVTNFRATATYSNGNTQDVTNQATWATTNGNIATVSNNNGSRGVSVALASGTVTITAVLNGVTGSTTLTVQAVAATLVSIAVTPQRQQLNVGQTLSYVATGTYSDGSTAIITQTAAWTVSNGTVAVVAVGLATAIGSGTTDVIATIGTVSGSATLRVR